MVAKKKTVNKKKRVVKKKVVTKKKRQSKKKIVVKKQRVNKKKNISKKKYQAKKKAVAKRKHRNKKKVVAKKKRQTKKKAAVRKKPTSKKKVVAKKKHHIKRKTAKKKNEVFLDWAKMDTGEAIYSELFRQLKVPKSLRNDFSRSNVEWVLGNLRYGDLTSLTPPYLFTNVNVSLVSYSTRDLMDYIIGYVFKITAAETRGTEVVVHQEGIEPTIHVTPDPTDIDRNRFISLIACAQWPMVVQKKIPPTGPARDNELNRLRVIHDQAVKDFIKTTLSPEELHLFVKSYDWDRRYKYLIDLIQNPACDLHTALLVFWLSGADYFQREHKKRPAAELYSGYHREAWDLVQKIKQTAEAGKYTESKMPDDFKKYVAIVPAGQQLWKLDSLMYGDKGKKSRKRKVAKKKGFAKKKALVNEYHNTHHACISSKSQLQMHLDLLHGVVATAKIQYFLGTGQLVNGSSESHSGLEACHVSEEVASSTSSYTVLYFDSKNRLSEIRNYYEDSSLPEYDYSPHSQQIVEAQKHTYRKYELVQPYEFTPNKKGKNRIGGVPPPDFVVPKLSSGLVLQYLGLLNHMDPAFGLRHDLHLVYPLFINFCTEVWIDYANPLAPLVINDNEVSNLDWVQFKEGDDIILESVSFKTEPWPTRARHGGHMGVPKWIQDSEVPICPKTNESMELICQLGDGDLSHAEMKKSLIAKKLVRKENFGQSASKENIKWIPGDGDLYVFFSKKSRIACYLYQGT